jgi:predicted site-specific integrase-resolvase
MELTYALGILDAAKSIGLSPWTIRKYLTTGKLKCTHIGRRTLIEPKELARLVEEGREAPMGRPVRKAKEAA